MTRPAPVKVLLADENEANADMLTRRLARRGFAVIRVIDGLAAVAQAHHEQPDVILMGLSLPALHGCEATRRIKADPRTADIPVIALTAHVLSTDRDRALAAGCAEFETKPIDFERLLATIARLLADRAPSLPSRALVGQS